MVVANAFAGAGVLRIGAVLALVLQLQGCYVLHTARGQLDLNARRQPIERVVADAATPPDVRAQLELATRIREFAVRELGLPDNGSYRTYADVGRPYVVWNVFATPEFSVDPKSWCFPVAGCVAYRGYFAERKARDFAAKLERDGYDVLVAGVPAYSTLGHFADPVLNTMLGWGEVQLAGTIFHELTHQLVYVPGDSAFNEALATVVEDEGVRRWLAAAGREAELAELRARRARQFRVSALLGDARQRLRTLYTAPMPAEQRRESKQAEFERLRAEYATLKRQWGRGGYDGLFGPRMNNASLLAVATYQDCVPGLEARLAAVEHDLSRFYEDARGLAKLSRAERHAEVCRPGAPVPGLVVQQATPPTGATAAAGGLAPPAGEPPGLSAGPPLPSSP
jgi:predicted aminopeptidase